MDDEENPPLTNFAQVYSHLEGKINGVDHKAIANIVTYKSELTPLSFPSSPTLEEGRQFAELSQYQEVRLHGFTAKQLKVLESFGRLIDDMELNIFDDSNTPVPISPIFDRQKWLAPLPKHLAPFPLGLGRQGYWEVSNDVVWEMLKPVLKFATMVLQKSGTWPWYNSINTSIENLPKAKQVGRFP